MTPDTSISEFSERIFSIEPSAHNIFGGDIPGLVGSSLSTSTAGADLVYSLRNSVAELAGLHKRGQKNDTYLKLVDNVEGLIQGLSTVGIINQSQANELIDQLHHAF